VVRVAAAPVDGEANEALLRLLGRALGLPPSALRIRHGAGGREKLVSVTGLGAPEARARLEQAAGARR
jgi:hypothetical protein